MIVHVLKRALEAGVAPAVVAAAEPKLCRLSRPEAAPY